MRVESGEEEERGANKGQDKSPDRLRMRRSSSLRHSAGNCREDRECKWTTRDLKTSQLYNSGRLSGCGQPGV
eukprot:681397-Hanusia_phi.AAC.1